jgi:hypothetical protein
MLQPQEVAGKRTYTFAHIAWNTRLFSLVPQLRQHVSAYPTVSMVAESELTIDQL